MEYFGPAGVLSNIEGRLQAVNLLAPTEMCCVMAEFGSDKAKNNYTPAYSALFNDRRDQHLRIFELGLGSNNPDVLSNMGVFGAPGASLRGWRELFPHALVYGADIDRRILFEEDRIKTFYCDQLDHLRFVRCGRTRICAAVQISLSRMVYIRLKRTSRSWKSHSITFVRVAFMSSKILDGKTSRSGTSVLDKVYSKQYPTHEFAFVVLADHGSNNVLVIRRPDRRGGTLRAEQITGAVLKRLNDSI